MASASSPKYSSPRFVIVGAGAIGTFVGLALDNAGFKVQFLQRDSATARTQRQLLEKVGLVGLCATDPEYRTEIEASRISNPEGQCPIFTTDPSCLSDLTDQDYILVTTKRGANQSLVKQFVEHVVKCPVFFLQNGMFVTKEVGTNNLEMVETVVSFNTVYDKGITTLAQSKEEAKLVFDGSKAGGRRLAQLLSDVGPNENRSNERRTFPLPFSTVAYMSGPLLDVQAGKLMLNMTNAVNALSGRPIKPMLLDSTYRVVLAACIKEVQNVFSAAGIKPAALTKQESTQLRFLWYLLLSPQWFFRLTVGRRLKGRETAFTSMAQDLMAKRVPTEIGYLNGEIVKMAREYDIEVPVNEALIEAVNRAETDILQNNLEGCPQYSGKKLMEITGARDSGVVGRFILNSALLLGGAALGHQMVRACL